MIDIAIWERGNLEIKLKTYSNFKTLCIEIDDVQITFFLHNVDFSDFAGMIIEAMENEDNAITFEEFKQMYYWKPRETK